MQSSVFSHLESKEVAEPNSAPSPFDIIYQAAQEKNLDKIKLILEEVSINIQQKGETPASRLAAEGKVEAVEFLRKNFNASLKWIIYGYGRGKRTKEAHSLLGLASNPLEWIDFLEYLVGGYARGGWIDEISHVFTLISPYSKSRFLEKFVINLAESGCEYNELVNLIKNFFGAQSEEQVWIIALSEIVQGYAQGGHTEIINNLLNSPSHASYRSTLFNWAVLGYVRGSWIEAAKSLIDKNPHFKNNSLSIFILRRYGRHPSKEFDTLLPLSALQGDFSLVILLGKWYAEAGYVREVNTLLDLISSRDFVEKSSFCLEMACAYIQADNLQQFHVMYDLFLNSVSSLSEDQYNLLIEREDVKNRRVAWDVSRSDLVKSVTPYFSDMKDLICRDVCKDVSVLKKNFSILLATSLLEHCIEKNKIKEINAILISFPELTNKAAVRIAQELSSRLLWPGKAQLQEFQRTIFFILAQFSSNLQTFIAKEIPRHLRGLTKIEKASLLNTLVPKTSELHFLIIASSPLNHPINFRYRVGRENWVQVKEWLLGTGNRFLRKGLSTDVLLLTITFLTSLSFGEAQQLYQALLINRQEKLNQKAALLEVKENMDNSHKLTRIAEVKPIPPVSQKIVPLEDLQLTICSLLDEYIKRRVSLCISILMVLGFYRARAAKLKIVEDLKSDLALLVFRPSLDETCKSYKNIKKKLNKAIQKNKIIENDKYLITTCWGCFLSLRKPAGPQPKRENVLGETLGKCLEAIPSISPKGAACS